VRPREQEQEIIPPGGSLGEQAKIIIEKTELARELEP
jgi:hypothetical protein